MDIRLGSTLQPTGNRPAGTAEAVQLDWESQRVVGVRLRAANGSIQTVSAQALAGGNTPSLGLRPPDQAQNSNQGKGMVSLREGVLVDATDGEVGALVAVAVDTESGGLHGFVINSASYGEGVLVPLDYVASVDEGRITLLVASEEIENLGRSNQGSVYP